MTKWVKRHPSMEFYREAEHKATAVIARVFGISTEMPEEVEQADRMMINIEGQYGHKDWQPLPGFPIPTEHHLSRCNLKEGWHWALAEARFLNFYHKYLLERCR
jgi:hypothetical protein